MKNFVLLLLMSLSLACSNGIGYKSNIDRELNFRKFFNKFSPLELPIEINIDYDGILRISNDFNFNSKDINLDSTDSIFIKLPGGPVWTVGYLPDTSLFYTLIYGISADMVTYGLVTFDKKYNRIDNKLIYIKNGCYTGARCMKCNSTIIFQNDFSVQCKDTLYNYDCDSLGETNEIIQSIEVLTKKMVVNETGTIEEFYNNSL